MKKNKFKSFKEFDKSLTSYYTAPEYVIAPAKDDKIFFSIKNKLKKKIKIIEPGIYTSN